MSNFRKFISMSAVAVLGATNLLTPLSYASAADVNDYDGKANPISTAASFSFLMPDHHVYLKAYSEANQYFVRYDGNTHTSGEMGTGTFTYDSHTGHLAPNAFAKTGYTWSSWNTGANGQGGSYESGAEVFNWTTVENGVVPVYAQWTPNTYSISYDLNPTNTGTSTPVHGASHPTGATYDDPFEVSNPTRTGYTFSGWDITNMDSEQHTVGGNASSATGASGVKGTGFNNLRATSGTVHFAAKWSPNQVGYVVEHYLQNLSGVYEIQTGDTQHLTGTADEEVKPSVKPYTGFTPNDAPVSGNVKPDGSQVFKYHYTRDSYKLTLTAGRGIKSVKGTGTVNTTGGSANADQSTEITFLYNEPVELSFVLKDGYEDGTWSGYLNAADSFTMPAFSTGKTAYAEPIVYNLTVNCLEGSPCTPSGTYTVESDPITLDTPKRVHSYFAGWTGTSIVGTAATVNIPTGSTGNRTYTATWTCHDGYTLKLDGTECIADADTQYTVRHRQQDLSGAYTINEKPDTYQTGQTDTVTDAHPIEITGFEVAHIATGNINGSGDTVVDIQYRRLSYTGTIVNPAGVAATSITATAEGDHPTGVAGTYKFEDTVTLNATLEDGYHFGGWTVTRKDNGQSVTVSGANSLSGATFQMPASEVTITPNVSKLPYTITYELHSGSVATPNNNHTGYNVETATFTLTNPTRDHSEFVGWSGGVIGETPTTAASVTIAKGSVGNRSYEAIWKCNPGYHDVDGTSCVANEYTVVVDYKDGGNGGGTRTGEVPFTYDKTGAIDNPTQPGYDFAGWIVTGTSGGNATVDGQPIASGDITSGTVFKNLTTEEGGTVTLTATWTARSDTKYKVYHYFEDVTLGTYTLSGTREYEGTTNTEAQFDDIAKITRTGFTFVGGYTTGGTVRPTGAVTKALIKKDGSTEIYFYYQRFTGDVYLSGDAHIAGLYWTQPQQVQYTGARQYAYEAEVSVKAEPAEGYHFKHWLKKKDSTFTTDGNGNEG